MVVAALVWPAIFATPVFGKQPRGGQPVSVLPQDSPPGIDEATQVEIQRRFNELRQELLDHRADTVTWWLSSIAAVLTVLAVVVAAAAYLAFRKFQQVEEEAKRTVERARSFAEEARKLAEEIRKSGEGDDESLRGIVSYGPGPSHIKADEEWTRDSGGAGGSAIAEARLLAGEGRVDEAIERWRQIANVAEGTNDNLAALALRSIGDLSTERNRGSKT